MCKGVRGMCVIGYERDCRRGYVRRVGSSVAPGECLHVEPGQWSVVSDSASPPASTRTE